jgi:hypothetical protein
MIYKASEEYLKINTKRLITAVRLIKKEMYKMIENKIKRNTIAIYGKSLLETNATKINDEIHATKIIGGWTLLNVRTGLYFQCTTDFLRRFVSITEQIA